MEYRHEYRFKLLSEAAFEGICIHDQGIILDANQQFADMFGYTVDEIKGMDCFNLIAPQSHEAVRGYISTGFEGPYEAHSLRKDGSTFPTEVRARNFHTDEKALRFAVFRDLTEYKKMKQRIVESEEKYRNLYEHSPIALYRTQINDGKVLECNQALAELFGYDSKEAFLVESDALKTYVNLDDRIRILEKLKKEKRIEGFQLNVKRKDGQEAWIEIAAEIYPERGYIEGAMLDITATKVLSRAEKKVLHLIIAGKSNKEVAKLLGRSARTIEDHRAHIMQKLGAGNLMELVQKARSLRPEPNE